jgi:L-alanine-DL-glutamate epimerase-like enolase superfamily enzyme
VFLRSDKNKQGHGVNGDPDILGYDKPMTKDGHIQLSDRPGFGIELNEELIKGKYLVDGEEWWD